jgi:hypothetical protein
MKATTTRMFVILVLMLLVGTPIGFLLEHFEIQNVVGRQISLVTYFIFLLVVSAVVAKIFDILFETWIGRIAAKIDGWLVSLLAGRKKSYLEYLSVWYRGFDTRGLTVQGDYNLELDRVYVELTLEEQGASAAKFSGTIWEFFKSKKDQTSTRFVILGSPGSGKTTLLRYVTLILSDRRKYGSNPDLFDLSNPPLLPDRLPIFLILRKHAQAIYDNQNLSLAHLIPDSLTGMDRAIPPEWFNAQLDKGRCIVMMDGLDEIADPEKRDDIAEWIQNQMVRYPDNHFVITSRPYGYEGSPLSGVRVLEIKDFTPKQVKLFVEKWYLANEIVRSNKDDAGVRLQAKESAKDLMQRLQVSPEITKLTVNPLLVTMIATVHSFKVKLPGRRVELYRDIFDVFLQRRRDVIWLNIRLSIDQQLELLKLIAYYMMRHKLREIWKNDAIQLMQHELASIAPGLTGGAFLKNVEQQSGLLLEAGIDHYQFAHLTFQEYLAAEHIRSDHTGERLKHLLEMIGDGWWAETTRLYAARTDATAIIHACLQEDPPSVSTLSLAMDCLSEAKKIQPEVRSRLERILNQSIESVEPERRALAAEAKLSSRLRWMSGLGSGCFIDTDVVTNVEYQLFLDEMRREGRCYQPDHWDRLRFSEGDGNAPVSGVRPQDAVRFCDWLTSRDIWHCKYRIPTMEEARSIGIECEGQLGYWVLSDSNATLYFHRGNGTPLELSQSTVVRLLDEDLDRLIRLREAEASRSQPRKTSAELLAGKYPLGLGGGSTRRVLGVPGREQEINLYFLRQTQNVALLTEYELYSKQFNLEVNKIIQDSADLFLTTREEKKRFADWLPVRKDYTFCEFDLENRFESTTGFLNSKEMRYLLDTRSATFADGLNRALVLLRMRKWAECDFEDSRARREAYAFLRWCARLCASSLAATVSRQTMARRGISKDVATICEDLIVDLAYLEERVQRRKQPCEGIRLVKIESS